MKNLARGALVALLILLVAASAAGAKPKPKHKPKPAAPAAHLFVIMLENHSKSSVLGDANAPYINALAKEYAVAEEYYGVTHPSEPNYVAAISGSNWFMNDDNPANRYDHTNLVDQLEANHKTWAAYMEAMPSAGFLGDSANGGLYASKHNPFVLFDDIRNNPKRLANIKPYTSLASDLAHNRVADFVWITPDQCNDMHGGVYSPVAGFPEAPCPYGSTNNDANDAALKQKADAFVKTTVQAITHSSAWTGNSA
ncbi:MAG: phosphoesterase, partial [Acidobacteriota bacterium]|nr:phosphoesterase [Acidobacteriota bacterium]